MCISCETGCLQCNLFLVYRYVYLNQIETRCDEMVGGGVFQWHWPPGTIENIVTRHRTESWWFRYIKQVPKIDNVKQVVIIIYVHANFRLLTLCSRCILDLINRILYKRKVCDIRAGWCVDLTGSLPCQLPWCDLQALIKRI